MDSRGETGEGRGGEKRRGLLARQKIKGGEKRNTNRGKEEEGEEMEEKTKEQTNKTKQIVTLPHNT